MGARLELQTLLETILGSRNVYFQPPETIKMQYPCIVYERTSGDTKFADDSPYNHQIKYQLMLVDKNPDSEILKKLALIKSCTFNTHFVRDNLNHDIYTIYF